MRNSINSTGMMTTEIVGLGVAGKLADGNPIAGNMISTGFSLGGMSSLTNTTFGKGGILDSMKGFGSTPRRRKR
jgi:hypothetical protein